jgi:hypothetical protein
MIGARKLNRTLSYTTAPEAIVSTASVKNFAQLLTQRFRWGSKSVHYAMADIQGLALLVSLTNLGILLMPLWFIIYTGYWPWLAGAWLLKTLSDLLLLQRISNISHQGDLLRWFVPVSLAYYPVFFISLLGALFGKHSWKRAD